MELCLILSNVYGHSNWPFIGYPICRSRKFIRTPYEAYQELKPEFQEIVRNFFGREIEKNDGLQDETRPVNWL